VVFTKIVAISGEVLGAKTPSYKLLFMVAKRCEAHTMGAIIPTCTKNNRIHYLIF
jgi:hypothetical protein